MNMFNLVPQFVDKTEAQARAKCFRCWPLVPSGSIPGNLISGLDNSQLSFSPPFIRDVSFSLTACS